MKNPSFQQTTARYDLLIESIVVGIVDRQEFAQPWRQTLLNIGVQQLLLKLLLRFVTSTIEGV